jgi:hypothetical protein
LFSARYTGYEAPNVRRFLVVAAAVSVTGCFHAVDEPTKDAGIDAGADAGLDAGRHFTDGGCDAPDDCLGSRMPVMFCGIVAGAGWSCVDNACLWECNGGRTCETSESPDGGCIHCDTLGTECRDSFCTNAGTRNATIDSSNCSAIAMGTAAVVSGGDGCNYSLTLANDRALGGFQEVGGGDFLATFDPLGGTCTGAILPTGAERWVFDCPTCEFVVRF